jgi:hypothetical protein
VTCEPAEDSHKVVTCPGARKTLGEVPNQVSREWPAAGGERKLETTQTSVSEPLRSEFDGRSSPRTMNSLPNTNSALQDASTTPNLAMDQNVQDGSHAINGSMPAGEPVHSTSLLKVSLFSV